MKININTIFLFLFSFSLSLSLFSQDFEVAPVIINFAVDPGSVGSRTVSVKNHGSKKQGFSLTLGDIERDSTGKEQRLSAGTSKRSCANWITINPSFFELNPNESKEIIVTIKVPSGESSSKWAAIYVKSVQEQTSQSAEKVTATGIIVSPRITIQVYQSPSSNTKYKAAISNLKEVTTQKDTVRKFAVHIVNSGDKKISAKVQLVVSNVETMKEKKYTPVAFTLFPGEGKDAILPLQDQLQKGTYSVAAILDYGNRTPLEAIQTLIKVE